MDYEKLYNKDYAFYYYIDLEEVYKNYASQKYPTFKKRLVSLHIPEKNNIESIRNKRELNKFFHFHFPKLLTVEERLKLPISSSHMKEILEEVTGKELFMILMR